MLLRLKRRSRVLRKRGRVLQKRGRVLKEVCLARGTGAGAKFFLTVQELDV